MCAYIQRHRERWNCHIPWIFVANTSFLLDVYIYYLWITLRSPSSVSGRIGAHHMPMRVLLISRMNNNIELSPQVIKSLTAGTYYYKDPIMVSSKTLQSNRQGLSLSKRSFHVKCTNPFLGKCFWPEGKHRKWPWLAIKFWS